LDYLYKEWAGKPVSMVSYGSHGGFQAALGVNLIIRGLKMQPLNNNLQISLHRADMDDQGHFIDVDQALAPYAFNAQQLGAEFQNSLAK
jgi:NAD(P)H-dependent FMN reductase